MPPPRTADGRLVLAVDVTPWLRADAATSNDRSFCHTYGRGENKHLMIPGWPTRGSSPWRSAALVDRAPGRPIRLRPGDDPAAVTAARVRELIERLLTVGQWHPGDRLLRDLPVEVLGRLRSDRVMRKPVPRPWISPPQGAATRARRRVHLQERHDLRRPHAEAKTDTTPATVPPTPGPGTGSTPKLQHRAALTDHPGELPVIEGMVIRLQVDRLPSGGDPKPLWPWWSRTGAGPADVDPARQALRRRFDIEHTSE